MNTLHEVFSIPIAEPLITFPNFDLTKTASLIQFMMLLGLLDDLFSIALRSSMYFYIPFRPNKLFETDFISFNAYCHSGFLWRYVVFIHFSPDYEMYIIFEERKSIMQLALKSAVFRVFSAVNYCSYYNQAASLTG